MKFKTFERWMYVFCIAWLLVVLFALARCNYNIQKYGLKKIGTELWEGTDSTNVE